MLAIIPEETIISANEECIRDGDLNNSFSKLLGYAKQFKDAEMTPLYIANIETGETHCVAKETWGKKLH